MTKKDLFAQIKQAKKTPQKLLASIEGPGGSGKSLTSLKIITALADNVIVIDGEEGKSSAYADHFKFDQLILDRNDEIWRPQNFNDLLIQLAEKYDGILTDGFSQEWKALNDYVEELAERIRKTGKEANTFSFWRLAKKYQSDLAATMQKLPVHQIYTLRSKTKYVMERDDKGKPQVRCLGMQSIQGGEMQYEFNYRFEMDLDHTLTVGKFYGDPDHKMSGKRYPLPGEEFINDLKEILGC